MELHSYQIFLLFVSVFGNISGAVDPPGPMEVERSVNKEEVAPNKTGEAAKNGPSTGWVSRSRIPTDMLSLKPEMFQTFYVFLGISFILVLLIVYRLFKLRSHRAERKYGVQGDKRAQELTPLPSAMVEEDESDLDDDIVFDINKTRLYVP